MKCLGIESTAHTFSCAVVDRKGKRGEILSDIRKIYGPPEGEGIHPREASRHHVETSSAVLAEALRKAKISVDDLDIISYAAGPGLGPCLRVGAVVSRTLSSYYKIPIYPVNHAIGHIELGKMLTGAKNLAETIHQDIAKGFLYAIDVKTKQRIGADHQLKNGDVIKIVSSLSRG